MPAQLPFSTSRNLPQDIFVSMVKRIVQIDSSSSDGKPWYLVVGKTGGTTGSPTKSTDGDYPLQANFQTSLIASSLTAHESCNSDDSPEGTVHSEVSKALGPARRIEVSRIVTKETTSSSNSILKRSAQQQERNLGQPQKSSSSRQTHSGDGGNR